MSKRKPRTQKKHNTEQPELNEITGSGPTPHTIAVMSYAGKEVRGVKVSDIQEMMDKDLHVAFLSSKRRAAVVGREWSIAPGSDSPRDLEIAAFVKDKLLSFSFDKARKELLTGIFYGLGISEVMWSRDENSIGVSRFIARNPASFTFDTERAPRKLTLKEPIKGEELPPKKMVVFTYSDQGWNDEPTGEGIGFKLWWYFWFKKNSLKFWALFGEKFGQPTVVGKYPTNAKKPEQDALMEAISSLQTNTAVKIPEGMIIELLEAKRRGSIDTYESFITYLENAQTKLVLMETLTSSKGEGGAYALGKIHNEVRLELVKADSDALSECFNNGFIRWLVGFNFANVEKYPQIWIDVTTPVDMEALAKVDDILVNKIKLPLTKKYFYDTYNRPTPDDGEELVRGQVSGGRKKVNNGDYHEFAESQEKDLVAELTTKVLENANLDPMINSIKKIMDESETMEEFRDNLLSAHGYMDETDLGNLMSEALFTADMAGRYETITNNT